MSKKLAKSEQKKPIYKQWWFWLIIAIIIIGVGGSGFSQKKENGGTAENTASETKTEIKDYTNQDAKTAYDELVNNGYSVRFMFDRNNNGGFTEDGFQEYVKESFDGSTSSSFVVTKQKTNNKDVTLYVDFSSIVEQDKEKEERGRKLEEKLGIVESMTACRQYGERNYRNFKIHSVVGKIAEYASDDDTWFLKYYVDAEGYNNKTMECYVTGTSNSPVVTKFIVY